MWPIPNPGERWSLLVDGEQCPCEIEDIGDPRLGLDGRTLLSQDIFVRKLANSNRYTTPREPELTNPPPLYKVTRQLKKQATQRSTAKWPKGEGLTPTSSQDVRMIAGVAPASQPPSCNLIQAGETPVPLPRRNKWTRRPSSLPRGWESLPSSSPQPRHTASPNPWKRPGTDHSEEPYCGSARQPPSRISLCSPGYWLS